MAKTKKNTEKKIKIEIGRKPRNKLKLEENHEIN